MKQVPIDLPKLSSASSWFASRLFASLPELVRHACMEADRDDPERFELRVEVPSPTGDPQRTIHIWMENGEPSLGFGEWHTHAGLFGDVQGAGHRGLIDTAAAILSDKFVLRFDVGGEYDGSCGVLDLRDEEAIIDEITSNHSPGTVDLRSWGGSIDRRVGVHDL